jgi:ribosomal protein S18 acetylase RimI-like enzyme
MNETIRWHKMKWREYGEVESLLKRREQWCVAACGKYLDKSSRGPVWTLRGPNGGVSALIVQSKRNLLPVFCGGREIPPPRFLCGIFGVTPIHSVQGLLEETVTLQNRMEPFGLYASENIDYELMSIDRPPAAGGSGGPAGLVLRRPQYTDMNALAALHAAYEQEEVLPRDAVFYPAASRMNIERIFACQQVLTAELGGRMVGKINTSAASFSRWQIGGVYVHPDYRGRGIAVRMTAEFVRSLVAQGRGVSLFVRKTNAAARRVYRRLGFTALADYRIAYYPG